jgi:hypothetical protein
MGTAFCTEGCDNMKTLSSASYSYGDYFCKRGCDSMQNLIFNTTAQILIGADFCHTGCNSLKSLKGGYTAIGDNFGVNGLFSLRYMDITTIDTIGVSFCANGCDNLKTIRVTEFDADLFTVNGELDMNEKFSALLSHDQGIEFADDTSIIRCKFD